MQEEPREPLVVKFKEPNTKTTYAVGLLAVVGTVKLGIAAHTPAQSSSPSPSSSPSSEETKSSGRLDLDFNHLRISSITQIEVENSELTKSMISVIAMLQGLTCTLSVVEKKGEHAKKKRKQVLVIDQ